MLYLSPHPLHYPVNEVYNPYQIFAANILHICKVTVNNKSIDVEIIKSNGSIFETFSLKKGK
ncbi:hypothetical protein AUJ66_00265 [Candidatus Desantisbacteria bacterium CG1_02_38_46]|uniref:Uncharacterized protein n=2 Tax=unclassified Candidatus Desantisiibacteriota TaxID=3106372 RepID=A0A2H9PAD7_9BACT|nr:MAG: hypothetical protein AUJ66_00265 [Candidatus Desantisbacteria bacterium CG1_02_38_46]PIZ15402.1 MAG: hypothetical protein COY51_05355 [Candidatus Desantisbacteria bacterium CG_4_10_14_0_8_um_filter_39_17]